VYEDICALECMTASTMAWQQTKVNTKFHFQRQLHELPKGTWTPTPGLEAPSLLKVRHRLKISISCVGTGRIVRLCDCLGLQCSSARDLTAWIQESATVHVSSVSSAGVCSRDTGVCQLMCYDPLVLLSICTTLIWVTSYETSISLNERDLWRYAA